MFSFARFGHPNSAKKCVYQTRQILPYGGSNGRILEALCEQLPEIGANVKCSPALAFYKHKS